jgi:hypothetical protein
LERAGVLDHHGKLDPGVARTGLILAMPEALTHEVTHRRYANDPGYRKQVDRQYASYPAGLKRVIGAVLPQYPVSSFADEFNAYLRGGQFLLDVPGRFLYDSRYWTSYQWKDNRLTITTYGGAEPIPAEIPRTLDPPK